MLLGEWIEAYQRHVEAVGDDRADDSRQVGDGVARQGLVLRWLGLSCLVHRVLPVSVREHVRQGALFHKWRSAPNRGLRIKENRPKFPSGGRSSPLAPLKVFACCTAAWNEAAAKTGVISILHDQV